MFKCKTCEVLNEQVTYLKSVIATLHEKLDIPIPETPGLKEDFKEDAEKPLMNKDGFEAQEVHDD